MSGRVRMEKCPRCGGIYVPIHVEQKGPHLGIYCSKYGHWIRWARKQDEEHVGMTTLWCSHCGIPYKFTQEELTQLLIAGILYVDCLNCSNEILLSSEPDSASS